ncbi:MAG: 50S ribosomal protein L33 [Myxococcales bacterium]|nr:50S ribosomal protein L33 [Myxococcales bacterium]
MSSRVQVVLVCSVCEARNYRTTRKPDQKGRIELKKYCARCDKHTAHKETK